MIKSIQVERLRQFIVFGERHLNYLVREYVRYYNGLRSHSHCEYLPPASTDPPPPNDSAVAEVILRHERLGGVIAWYERCAA